MLERSLGSTDNGRNLHFLSGSGDSWAQEDGELFVKEGYVSWTMKKGRLVAYLLPFFSVSPSPTSLTPLP